MPDRLTGVTERCEVEAKPVENRTYLGDFTGVRVLVVGLGHWGGGVAVTRWLVRQGAVVTISDAADADRLSDSLTQLKGLDVRLHLGGNDAADLDDADLVVLNPGVNKHTSALYAEMTRRSIPCTTEMNLFVERCPSFVLGVTGSFGKSTTCAMLAGALQACAVSGYPPWRKVVLGGNIGRSLLPELDTLTADDLVILEISNAQLEDLPRIAWHPQAAVITNIFPQHLDRYAGFADYIHTKLDILGPARRTSVAVVGPLAPEAQALFEARCARDSLTPMRVSAETDTPDLLVPGPHNAANAACALTVCRALGAPIPTVRTALEQFQGLPHRLAFVCEVGGARYYDDSKATAPTAVCTALRAFAGASLIVLVGGQYKDVPLEEAARALIRTTRACICFGEAAEQWRRALAAETASCGAASEVRAVDSLAQAVTTARSLTQPGDTVLFCPGAPSFDAYRNFEYRGRHFVELVKGL